MLIEVLFRGSLPNINLTFLKPLITGAREIHFNAPEISSINSFDEIMNIIRSNTYADLAISTDYLDINGKIVSSVFINLGRDSKEIDVLFFFDLLNLNELTPKMNIDYLRRWIIEIREKYNFEYFICQMNNANKDEYYFDSNGLGDLYYRLQ